MTDDEPSRRPKRNEHLRDLAVASMEAAATLLISIDPSAPKAIRRVAVGQAHALIKSALLNVELCLKELKP